MKITILLPHYKTREMTAYAVKKFIEHVGNHDVNLIIIDNGQGVGLDLIPRHPMVKIVTYPSGILQSHGIAFDYVLKTMPEEVAEHFITVESDSFPTRTGWLNYYESHINEGYDLIGAHLDLSGGHFVHPAGTMYKKSNWNQAIDDLGRYGYYYYDSAGPGGYHLMTKTKLSGGDMEAKRIYYLPLTESVFHQGMGFKDDNFKTYGQRTMESEAPYILPRNGAEQYLRVAYEPGQWFAYWHLAAGKKIQYIPVQCVWMPNRVNQQQEYSLMEHGFKHLWGITAYANCDDNPKMMDIINFKRNQAKMLEGYGS